MISCFYFLCRTLLYGVLWLFLFSIPVGHGKKLYHVAYYYIIDTQYVHWIFEKISFGMHKTSTSVNKISAEIVSKVETP